MNHVQFELLGYTAQINWFGAMPINVFFFVYLLKKTNVLFCAEFTGDF